MAALAMSGAALGCSKLRAQTSVEEYQGVAELKERVLAFEVGGRIVTLRVHEGDRVKAGELLGTVDGAVEEQARQARDLEAQAAEVQAKLVKKGVRGEEIAVTRARLRGAQAAEALLKKQIERGITLRGGGFDDVYGEFVWLCGFFGALVLLTSLRFRKKLL